MAADGIICFALFRCDDPALRADRSRSGGSPGSRVRSRINRRSFGGYVVWPGRVSSPGTAGEFTRR